MSDTYRASGVRVVHVSAHYPPFLGGLENVVESLAVQRRSQGLPVRVVTSAEDHAGRREADDATYVRRLRSREVAHTSIMPRLPRELWGLERDSVIHLHISQAYVPEVVYLTHVLRGVPYLAHLHIDAGPSGRAGFLLDVYKPLVLRRVLRGAAMVVVFTDEQRAIVSQRYGVRPERIAVIPNGVDESFFCEAERALHVKPRLLFVGRLAVQKNVRWLLEALDGVSHRFETTIVGDGELDAELKQRVQDLRLENVRFHGRADGEVLRALYRAADIFVLPSEREGMPLVMLEAMAMGLPIVATDIAGNRDLVVQGANGVLVELGQTEAMREALLHVSSDDERYRRMSKQSSGMARRYSWQVVGTEFERLYAQASESRHHDAQNGGRAPTERPSSASVLEEAR